MRSVASLAVYFICLLYIAGCGRYEGHNGYYFAWRDFEKEHIVDADLDGNMETTRCEMEAFKLMWLTAKGWRIRSGFYQVYDNQGNKIPASVFARAFKHHELVERENNEDR